MIIVVLGPDGVGKTTIATEFAQSYGYTYIYGGSRNPATFILKYRQKKAQKKLQKAQTGFTQQRVKKSFKSQVMRYLSLFLLLYDGWIKLKKLKKSYQNIIIDRSVIDIFVQNDEMWNLPNRDFIVKLFQGYFHKIVLLVASPQEIYKRKAELSIEEIQKQLERYKYIVTLLDGKIIHNDNKNRTIEVIRNG